MAVTARQPDVIALGEPMMEFNQNDPAEPSRYLAGAGGDTSNVAIAAARQGADAGYLTALGADVFGDQFVDLWRAENVDCNHVKRDRAAHTAIYFVTHTARGHAFSYFRAGSAASRMTPTDLPEDYIAGAKVLHLSAISQAISASARATVDRAISIARDNGVRVSYDTNLRLQLWDLAEARSVIHETIARADVALPGLEDSAKLTGIDDPDRIVDAYRDFGAEVVVLKCGAAGALVAAGTERASIPGFAVDAVDATAAGDTFDGAFLAEFVAHGDPVGAAYYANAAAALSTTGFGAVTPIPTRDAVETFLHRHAND